MEESTRKRHFKLIRTGGDRPVGSSIVRGRYSVFVDMTFYGKVTYNFNKEMYTYVFEGKIIFETKRINEMKDLLRNEE